MKKKHLVGAGLSLALLFSTSEYALGQYQAKTQSDNQVNLVGTSEKKNKLKTNSVSSKSQTDFNKEEGISAEQIVVKITDKGYVTSHGDHYHYYNGKVLYDALISEELIMTDPNYVFNKSDIINEVKDGFIIKFKENYYLYLKEGSKKENVRTKEQIAEQVAKGTQEAKNKSISSDNKGHNQFVTTNKQVQEAKRQGRYTTDDGYVFNPSDVIEDTGDAFIVPHGNHFHYIPKADLSASELAQAQSLWNNKHGKTKSQPIAHSSNLAHSGNATNYPQIGKIGGANVYYPKRTVTQNHTSQPAKEKHDSPKLPISKDKIAYKDLLNQLYALPKSQRHQEDDGLLFDPNQVTKLTSRGYVIPHGDHWHVVPKNKLSALEIQLADMHLSGQEYADKLRVIRPTIPKPVDHVPAKQKINLTDGKIKKTKQGKDGKPYSTDDGYHFSMASITSYDKDGVTADHDGHEHYIPYSELEDNELKLLEDAINQKNSKIVKIADSSFSKEELAKKLQYLSLQNNVPIDQLTVTGNKVVVPHGNHSHTMDLAKIPTHLTSEFYGSDEDYKDIIIQLKMGQAKQDYQTEDVIREGGDLIIYAADGSSKRVALNDIKLPLDYNELDLSKEPANRTELDDKLDYIASQYKVPRTKLVRVLNYIYVEGKPSVDLNKVNVADPVLYTLKEASPIDNEVSPNAPAIAEGKEQVEEKEEEAADDVIDNDTNSNSDSEIPVDNSDLSEEEVDPYDAKMAQLAQQYGLDADTVESRLTAIAIKYGVNVDQMNFGPTVTFASNGQKISFDLVSNQIKN